MTFTVLLQDSFQRLITAFPHEEIDLPAKYATAVHPESQGQTVIKNRFLRVNSLGEVRSVSIQAPKVDIVNLFFFPQPTLDLPIFSMEFVTLGTRPKVGVIDLLGASPQLPCQQQAQKILIQTHHAFPQLMPDNNPPLWYQACRSGFDFFIRPKKKEELGALQSAHLQVWEGLLTLLHHPQPLSSNQQALHRQSLAAYKLHHRQNTPGLPFLQRCFGKQWTAQYLSHYLFY